MRVLRGLLGSLLWILAGLLGLLGVLTSVTVILLPVGIPLLMLSRRLFKYSMTLFLPRVARHPAKVAGESLRDLGQGKVKAGKKAGRKAGKKARKKLGKATGKGSLLPGRRHRLPV